MRISDLSSDLFSSDLGIGARPLMQYGIDVAELALRHTLAKVVFMHVVGNLRAHQIDELVAVGKIVDHQNIAVSGAVQPTHQVAADKNIGKEECRERVLEDV